MSETENTKPTYNQATKIVAKLGGAVATAKAIGCNKATVYKWGYPRPRGCDGIIPSFAQIAILKYAETHGITLTPEDWAVEKTP